jgi:hypothetical protein
VIGGGEEQLEGSPICGPQLGLIDYFLEGLQLVAMGQRYHWIFVIPPL